MSNRLIALLCALVMLLALAPAAIAEEPVTLTLFVDESWWPYDTWEGAIPEKFDEITGVKIEAIRAAITPYLVQNPVIGLIRMETDSDEAVIQAKLNDMVGNEEINILMAESEEECVAAYEAMLAKADQIGVAKLVEYGNATYSELKPQYDAIADLPME